MQYEGTLPSNPPLYPPNSLGVTDFWHWGGPQPKKQGIGVATTPWIIGGGYTDGMHVVDLPSIYTNIDALGLAPNAGMNFMGGKWGGKKSGLHGYIGSMKLYNRGITSGEVLKNYEAQRGFFENLRV